MTEERELQVVTKTRYDVLPGGRSCGSERTFGLKMEEGKRAGGEGGLVAGPHSIQLLYLGTAGIFSSEQHWIFQEGKKAPPGRVFLTWN